jgi:hypothetical protein
MTLLDDPNESHLTLVARALQARLQTIDLTTEDPDDSSKRLYWYGPPVVIRPIAVAEVNLEPQHDVVYQIVKDSDMPEEQAAGIYERVAEFWVAGAKRWTAATLNPYADPIAVADVAERLGEDVWHAIMLDWQLGGLVDNTELRRLGAGYLDSGWVISWTLVRVTFKIEAMRP